VEMDFILKMINESEVTRGGNLTIKSSFYLQQTILSLIFDF